VFGLNNHFFPHHWSQHPAAYQNAPSPGECIRDDPATGSSRWHQDAHWQSHVQGHWHHGVFEERWNAGAGCCNGKSCVNPHNAALRPPPGRAYPGRGRTDFYLNVCVRVPKRANGCPATTQQITAIPRDLNGDVERGSKSDTDACPVSRIAYPGLNPSKLQRPEIRSNTGQLGSTGTTHDGTTDSAKFPLSIYWIRRSSPEGSPSVRRW
jgi:hypothetical protein